MEENHKTPLTRWLETAVSGIRFKPDRAAVEQELREHIEDKTADLLRIFPGMPQEEAEKRALSQMGDAEKIGKELARIHRPWWGYLWKCSRVVLGLVLVISLLAWGGWIWERVETWVGQRQQEKSESQYIKSCYYNGIDPFGPDSPYYKEGEQTEVVRTPLRVFRPADTVRVGEYRIGVEQAALWSFQDGGPEEDWWLFCELLAQGPPWQPLGWSVMNYVRAVDSLGNEYYSSHEVYDLRVDRGDAGYVMANWSPSDGQGAHYDLQIMNIQPGAEWLRLEYDRAGKQWSLTIPLTEGKA